MRLIRTEQSSHWYTRDGEPMHAVEKADGSGTTPTTLAHARKLGLLPSVTNVLSVLDKGGLNDWKMSRVAIAADMHPRGQDEPIEEWAVRVRDEAFSVVDEAADLGTAIHAAIDQALGGQPYDQALQPYVQPAMDEIARLRLSRIRREVVVVSTRHGYAGRTDLVAVTAELDMPVVVDFKTRRTRPGSKAPAYRDNPMQLAAYGMAHFKRSGIRDLCGHNVIISTTEPGRVDVQTHTQLAESWEAFKSALKLWRYEKDFDPRKEIVHDQHA